MQDNWTRCKFANGGPGGRLHPGEEIRFLLADVEQRRKGRRVKLPPWGRGREGRCLQNIRISG